MPRKQKKYHYLYKTTNLINGKFYIGIHSTDDLNDGYVGSGKYLRNSINKYGNENFKCEILEFFENRKALVDKEKKIVNEEFIKVPLCMNLRPGGEGGFISVENQFKRAQAGGIAMKKKTSAKRKHEICILAGKKSLELKVGIHDKKNCYDWNGKNHSDETKLKMSEKAKLRLGNKNSQFGTCWIHNNKESKKVKSEELIKWTTLGWIKGRKINFN